MMSHGKSTQDPPLPTGCLIFAAGGLVIVVLLIALFLSQGLAIESGLRRGTATPTPNLPALSKPVFDASAMVVSGNAVTIHWEPVDGADRYLITFWRNADSSRRARVLENGETQDTSYTVDGLDAGTEYTFGVFAFGDELRYRPSPRADVKLIIPSPDGTAEESEAELEPPSRGKGEDIFP